MPANDHADDRCALIIAHPGHELRVLGWLARARPVVAVLTDGSGHGEHSRIGLTTALLERAGASQAAVYAPSPDRAVYTAMLTRDHRFFLDLAERLRAVLLEHRIECVAGDMIEGYNPTHDLCRVLIDRAVRLAERESGRDIRNLAFALEGPPRPESISSQAWEVRVEGPEFADKLAQMRHYGRLTGGNLEANIGDGLSRHGETAFRDEVLDVMDTAQALSRFEVEKPFYEVYGEQQVGAGHYRFVIRYREHIAPLARALLE
jgi:hypothetical protein